MPVCLLLSNNNTSDTGLQAFMSAKREYGMPERVRSDKGMENIKVARYMLEVKGTGRGSHIAGRSVHNQRLVIVLLYQRINLLINLRVQRTLFTVTEQ